MTKLTSTFFLVIKKNWSMTEKTDGCYALKLSKSFQCM